MPVSPSYFDATYSDVVDQLFQWFLWKHLRFPLLQCQLGCPNAPKQIIPRWPPTLPGFGGLQGTLSRISCWSRPCSCHLSYNLHIRIVLPAGCPRTFFCTNVRCRHMAVQSDSEESFLTILNSDPAPLPSPFCCFYLSEFVSS